jgi:hypothetical protein
MRERGIGNLPFIAVLVLFVIAVALWFMATSEVDSLKESNAKLDATAKTANQRFVKMQDAYNALVGVVGIATPELSMTGEAIPKKEDIETKIRAYLNKTVNDIAREGTVNLQTKNYQVPQGQGVIQTPAGEMTTVKLYGVPQSEDTITVRGLLDPLSMQFAFAKKVIEENNRKFHEETEAYGTRVSTLQEANSQIQSSYTSDLEEKQRQAETWRSSLDETRTNFDAVTAKLDEKEVALAQVKDDSARKVRTLERDLQAWKERALNEKQQKELALAEDPKDGEVIAVSKTLDTIWINLGTRDKLSRGTKFTVWRPGKGNVREDVAVVRVINVFETRSEANLVELINPRVPVTPEMNVSNPFFDSKRPLKVYIYGDLKRYPTDVAARRLAASGAMVSRVLDDTVNVIVLGEPPVAAEEEMPEDELEAAAAEKRQAMQRDKRLAEVRRVAISIGAIVVTEDVLATFIDY